MNGKVWAMTAFGVFLSLALGFFIIPTKLTIERAVLVDASPQAIYPHIVDLSAWEAWDPWRVEGVGVPGKGVGAQRPWPHGGTLHVQDVEQDIRIQYTIDESARPSNGTIELLNDDGGTVVVWTHYTQTGYLPQQRLSGWVDRSALALEMDDALSMLKAGIEGSDENTSAPR